MRSPVGERCVALVDVAGEERGAAGVRAGAEDGGHVQYVGRQPCRVQRVDEHVGRDEYLAAHVPALLGGGQLVLEVDAGGSGLDHAAHQLEGMDGAAETGLGVRNDWHEVVEVRLAVQALDLVGPHESVVEPLHDGWNAVGGIEALVRVSVGGQVGVAGHLPAAEVEGLESALDHVHGLCAGQGAECTNEAVAVEVIPQALGPALRQRVLDLDAVAQLHHGFCRKVSLYALPTWVRCPALFKRSHLLVEVPMVVVHVLPPYPCCSTRLLNSRVFFASIPV